MRRPQHLMIWALSILLGGCAPNSLDRVLSASAEGGIGGTGMEFWQGGIGGTGVVGTITGFGSIVVNGMHIAYDPKMALRTITPRTTAASLRVGQLVSLEADRLNGRLSARAIEVRYQLAGPIEAIDEKTSRLRILGQSVHVRPQTNLDLVGTSQARGIAALRIGENVMVSGLRNGAVIEAGYVRRSPRADFAALRGTVSGVSKNAIFVNGRRILLARVKPALGRTVQIVGRLSKGAIRAQRIEVQPTTPFAGRVSRLSLEGFVKRRGPAGDVVMDRVALDVKALRGSILKNGKRAIVFGVLEQGDRGKFKALRSFDPKTFNGARGAPSPAAAKVERAERATQTRITPLFGREASTWGGRSSGGGSSGGSSGGGRSGGGGGSGGHSGGGDHPGGGF